MASNKSRTQSELRQFFRGGKGMPEDLVRRCLRDLQEKRKARSNERSAIALQAAKHLGEIQKSARSAAGDPRTANARSGPLAIHKKLAKHKLAPPNPAPGPGGIVAGTFSVTTTPPFDFPEMYSGYDTTPGTFKPIQTGSANISTGQITASSVTASDPGFSEGDMYTAVGVYFHPMAAGTLTVYANPIYSYEWWTETFIPYPIVQSSLNGSLNIQGVHLFTGGSTAGTSAAKAFIAFNEEQTGPLMFQDAFNQQTSVSVSVPVDQTQVYLIFVSAYTSVYGFGALGSIAGAMLSVTVPSITYEFQLQPVIGA